MKLEAPTGRLSYPPVISISPAILLGGAVYEALLIDSLNPDFNMIEFEAATFGHSLFHLGIHFFDLFDFQNKMNVDRFVFATWLLKIEGGYRIANPYHNASHAADVLHSMVFFIRRPKIFLNLSIEDIFACVVASIIHDFKHPGVNNAFLIATSNPLAIRYNDLGVLEAFHVASVFELMLDPKYDILATLSPDLKRYEREMIIGMVLATDMAFHFEWIGKFKTKMATTGIMFDNRNDKKICLHLSIKCSDLNNSAKTNLQSRIWTQLVMEEFFKQGDEENVRSLPISVFMDRTSTDIPKCQVVSDDLIVGIH